MVEMEKAWARKVNPAVQETIRVAVERLSNDGRRKVTKKHILKVLFLARERLPGDNNLKQDLAYYWYKDGPYSEVVDANLSQMVADGLVMIHKSAKPQTFQMAPEHSLRPVVAGADLDIVRHEIGLVASENPDVCDAVKHAYKMAPSQWYTTYNLKFKPKFDSYCKHASSGHEDNRANLDMRGRLDDSVLDYPTVPEFLEHRMIFMDFAKIVNALLRQDPRHIPKDAYEWLPDLCSAIWDTFAYGVRVHHHDPPYGTHIERWTEMYADALDKLEYETARRMEQFGDVGVDEPDLAPEIEDMTLHPEKHVFTPLSLDEIVADR